MSEPAGEMQRPRRFRPFRRIRKFIRRFRGRGGAERDTVLAERGYVICTTPRSGSTYFCSLLSSTGLLGRPREYFNVSDRRNGDPAYPSDPRNILDAIRSTGATANGIYAVKLHPSHLQFIDGRVDPLRDLPNARLLRLVRRDRLGQAISLARAEQTGKYGSRQPSAAPRAYDGAQIRACLERLQEYEALWAGLMKGLGVWPLEIHYESLTLDPQAAVDRVAGLMGVPQPAPIDLRRVPNVVQRDEISEEWRRRFLAETGDAFRHLAWPVTPPSPPDSASAS